MNQSAEQVCASLAALRGRLEDPAYPSTREDLLAVLTLVNQLVAYVERCEGLTAIIEKLSATLTDELAAVLLASEQ